MTPRKDNTHINKRSSGTLTETTSYTTGDESMVMNSQKMKMKEVQQMNKSHPIIESGFIREFSIHVLGTSASTTIEINQLAESGIHRAIEIIRNSKKYRRIENLLQKRDGDCSGIVEHTLGARVTVGHRIWEIVVFEAFYPPIGEVYLVFGRSIDHESSSIAAIFDPEQNETDNPSTLTVFEINTERIKPITITLDQQLTNPNCTSSPQSSSLGYLIAIDWFSF